MNDSDLLSLHAIDLIFLSVYFLNESSGRVGKEEQNSDDSVLLLLTGRRKHSSLEGRIWESGHMKTQRTFTYVAVMSCLFGRHAGL